MGTARQGFATLAIFAAGLAQAQQQEAVSPYSLGLSVGRAPIGLNLSLVGRAQASSFSAFGKFGTTTAPRPDTTVMGMSSATWMQMQDPPTGLSWGGGVSWDFSPRLTATFEWISYELRLANGPIRTTTLGLQYRY